jgi:hypothetical protein
MALDVQRLVEHLRSGVEPEIALDGGCACCMDRREGARAECGEDRASFYHPEAPPAGEVWLSIRTMRK